jgi:hypothetical protein
MVASRWMVEPFLPRHYFDIGTAAKSPAARS